MNNIESIKINQRIPIYVLEEAFKQYLTDKKDKDYILEQIRIDSTGENRINKSYLVVNSVIFNNPINKYIESYKNNFIKLFSNSINKHIILTSLICSCYPYAHSLLYELGSIFKVQDIVNTNVILSKMKSIYGSNRVCENAFYSLIPMFIDLKIINRIKTGLYSHGDFYNLEDNDITELFLISFLINNSNKKVLLEDISYNPYFFFYKISVNNLKFKNIKIFDSRIGGGYISL
ncbi:hypothetical protein KAZ01_02695 [Candidatus Gracilibacteria bacterium]|jgi:hypothetical protein|nr:hypothetical protein [Candidatus Gracilibacteria bacterium]